MRRRWNRRLFDGCWLDAGWMLAGCCLEPFFVLYLLFFVLNILILVLVFGDGGKETAGRRIVVLSLASMRESKFGITYL